MLSETPDHLVPYTQKPMLYSCCLPVLFYQLLNNIGFCDYGTKRSGISERTSYQINLQHRVHIYSMMHASSWQRRQFQVKMCFSGLINLNAAPNLELCIYSSKFKALESWLNFAVDQRHGEILSSQWEFFRYDPS